MIVDRKKIAYRLKESLLIIQRDKEVKRSMEMQVKLELGKALVELLDQYRNEGYTNINVHLSKEEKIDTALYTPIYDLIMSVTLDIHNK